MPTREERMMKGFLNRIKDIMREINEMPVLEIVRGKGALRQRRVGKQQEQIKNAERKFLGECLAVPCTPYNRVICIAQKSEGGLTDCTLN
jgi:hypothetical protein